MVEEDEEGTEMAKEDTGGETEELVTNPESPTPEGNKDEGVLGRLS